VAVPAPTAAAAPPEIRERPRAAKKRTAKPSARPATAAPATPSPALLGDPNDLPIR
jgi:hypothetical protein